MGTFQLGFEDFHRPTLGIERVGVGQDGLGKTSAGSLFVLPQNGYNEGRAKGSSMKHHDHQQLTYTKFDFAMHDFTTALGFLMIGALVIRLFL
jgi:hypothetical protein